MDSLGLGEKMDSRGLGDKMYSWLQRVQSGAIHTGTLIQPLKLHIPPNPSPEAKP